MKDNKVELTNEQVDVKFAEMLAGVANNQDEMRKLFGVTTDDVEAEALRVKAVMKSLFQVAVLDEFLIEGFQLTIERSASFYPIKLEIVLTHLPSSNVVGGLTALNARAAEVSDWFRKEKGLGNKIALAYKIAN